MGRLALLVLLVSGCASSPPSADEPYALVFLSSRAGPSHLHRLDLATGAVRQLTTGDSSVYAPRWVPGARAVVYVSAAAAPPMLLRLPEAAALFPNPAGDEAPDWSPDGTAILYAAPSGPTTDVFLADAQGQNPEAVAPSPATDKQPRWSPDGHRIAFVSDRAGNQDVWVLDRDTGALSNVTDHPALEGHPEWAPDNERLLFYRYEDGDADLYTVRLGEAPQNLTQSEGNELVGRWSPDGAWVAFGSARDDDWELYRVRPDGTGLQRLTTSPGFDGDPVWIPASLLP